MVGNKFLAPDHKIKNTQFGIKFKGGNVNSKIHIQLLTEDDENWHNHGGQFNAFWIDDLIKVLTDAKKLLTAHAVKEDFGWGYPKSSEIDMKNKALKDRIAINCGDQLPAVSLRDITDTVVKNARGKLSDLANLSPIKLYLYLSSEKAGPEGLDLLRASTEKLADCRAEALGLKYIFCIQADEI